MNSVPLNSPKMKHWIEITDIFINLYATGSLKYFEVELREHFPVKRTYSPDILFVYDNIPHLCEVQLKRLSRGEWAKKWRMANVYFNQHHYHKASWQRWSKRDPIKPQFIALTDQPSEIVENGFEVIGRKLIVAKKIPPIGG